MKKSIIVLIGFFIIIVSLYFFLDEIKVNIIISLLAVLCSFLTLLIALQLFDKYNAGSKFLDKNINIVVEYIDFLKTNFFILKHYRFEKTDLNLYGFKLLEFSSNIKNDLIFKDTKVYYDMDSFILFNDQANKYLNSVWMPKDIKEASNFLRAKESHNVFGLKSIKEHISILYFGANKDKTENEINILFEYDKVDILTNNINNLMLTIKNWINKQASDIYIDI